MVLMAVGRRGSAGSTIASAMPWSAGSTGSSATVRWRPYDKLSVRYQATVLVAAINEWL
jgi:hypothetical protein